MYTMITAHYIKIGKEKMNSIKLATIVLSICLVTACSTVEILPNLCYSDNRGTWTCPDSCEEDMDIYPKVIRNPPCVMQYTPTIKIL